MTVRAAALRARAAAERLPDRFEPRADAAPGTRTYAIGDPQADLERFLEILDQHRLLDENGGLAADAHLVSIGDHFDWGRVAERSKAAGDGLAILAWLASHPPDCVTLIAGNHDLARVGELVAFDDARFAKTQREADLLYYDSQGGRQDAPIEAERGFRLRHPELPGVESAARDLSTFRKAQRDLVERLLRDRRFSVAAAGDDHLVFCHAGVTRDHLTQLGLPDGRHREARAVAGALNQALDDAFDRWDGLSPFSITGLHLPGTAAAGEARGIFVNRPGNPDHERAVGSAGAAEYAGPPRRRYDPRWLPAGLTQAIGHIRDDKCRRLLGPWAEGAPGRPGRLRHLRVEGDRVTYRPGLPAREAEPALVFLDGAMRDTGPRDYELFAADRFAAARV